MKVLFFSEEFGSTSFITSQVVQISRCHQVLYICNHRRNYMISAFEISEIPFRYSVIATKFRDRLEMHQIYLTFFNPTFGQRLKREVLEFDPDIIHLQFGYEALRFIDNFPNPEKVPIIIHFRGYDASQKLSNKAYVRRIERLLDSSTIYAISVSDHLLSNIKKKGIMFRNAPWKLHSNTDLSFFSRSNYQIDNSIFRLIQISSFREKKGHEYTLKALRRYIDYSGDSLITLTFTGETEGIHYKRIQTIVKDLGLESFVNFVGFASRNQVRDLLENSHCAVLHSITPSDGDQEGIPNALMEAMAMEMPVISTYHSGIPELIVENECSILVNEKDIKSYANAIATIRNNWKWIPENRKIVEQHFSDVGFIKKLNSIYDHITANTII
ncbi:MAG: glycosyltransferase [Cyclobacteriaceae bacterium]